jgi:hypothetical protein
VYDFGDTLLFALSAWRETSWAAFKKTFDEIFSRSLVGENLGDPETVRYERGMAARLLVSLGHCETQFVGGRGRLYVAPPVLVALPSPGLPRVVLCGARSPGTVPALQRASGGVKHAVRIEVMSQSSRSLYAPSRVEAEGVTHESLRQLASIVGVPYASLPPAWTIAEFSGGVGEYCDALAWSPLPELTWERADFDTGLLRFLPPSEESEEMRLSRYQDPARPRFLYRLYKDGLGVEVDAEWGRYAVVREVNVSAVAYDESTGEVAVPQSVPLPPLLARACALCTGYAPRTIPRSAASSDLPGRSRLTVYDGVPPDVLATVAAKAGQAAKVGRLSVERSYV